MTIVGRGAIAAAVMCLSITAGGQEKTAPLTVLTWNVSITLQADGYARGQMAFVAGLQPRPEVVVLQEADYNLHVQHDSYLGGLSAAAPGTKWSGIFARACDVAAGASCSEWETNGVLVAPSLPVTSSEARLFVHCDYWHAARPAARLAVTKGGRSLQVFGTHLQPDDPAGQPRSTACATAHGSAHPSRRSERLASIDELKRWAHTYDAPRLIGGDFNASPDSPEVSDPRSGMASAYADAWTGSERQGYTFRLSEGCGTQELRARIDYWFLDRAPAPSGAIAISRLAADLPGMRDCYRGSPSDHLAVRVQYRVTDLTR